MCDTCGCNQPDNTVKIFKPGEENPGVHEHQYFHDHTHDHDHGEHSHPHKHSYSHSHDGGNTFHEHDHEESHSEHSHTHAHDSTVNSGREIIIEANILKKNDLLAERNRGFFEAKKIFTINLVSSPGAGKTTLLEKTIRDIGNDFNIFVIEGDLQTDNDSMRIKQAGAAAIQINTGQGCHLDAAMVNTAVKKLKVQEKSLLFIENVGNLVCPAMFDLGELKRVVILSLTEGNDKPLKYPGMFRTADLCIINKCDLKPYLDTDPKILIQNALKVNHHLEFIELSAKTAEGTGNWYKWLKKEAEKFIAT